MTRRFLDSIRADVNSQIVPNEEGLVTATIVNNLMLDMIDSTVQDEAAIANDAATQITVALDENWLVLSNAVNAAMWDRAFGGDGDFLNMDMAAGTITTRAEAGWTYNAIGAVTLDAPTNIVIECGFGINGLPGGGLDLESSIVGTSGTRFQSMFVQRYKVASDVSDTYSMMLRAPAGATTIELTSRTWGLIILPTNNP